MKNAYLESRIGPNGRMGKWIAIRLLLLNCIIIKLPSTCNKVSSECRAKLFIS